jgi:hypothetical protein
MDVHEHSVRVATSSKGLHAERPNNSGVRVNLSSTHLGVGAPRRALIRCVGAHGRCDRVGAMSNPPPDAPLRFTCTVSVGDRKEQQPRIAVTHVASHPTSEVGSACHNRFGRLTASD